MFLKNYTSNVPVSQTMRRIKPVSDKRRREKRIYEIKRKDFLIEHPWCEWALRKLKQRIRATQIHHKRGRAGKLYLDARFWQAVCGEGHKWIHNNIEEARKLGLFCQRGEWGKQP